METPQINTARALCSTTYRDQAHLWDAEIDGGSEKHAKGESSKQRKIRHSIAQAICSTCPEQLVCRWVGMNQPGRQGMYGGDLVD